MRTLLLLLDATRLGLGSFGSGLRHAGGGSWFASFGSSGSSGLRWVSRLDSSHVGDDSKGKAMLRMVEKSDD